MDKCTLTKYNMKIVFLSDTHQRHHDVDIPNGDILIHAGDFSSRGTVQEVTDFLNWFSKQPHKYKIFIAGNHDFFFEREREETIRKIIPKNLIYLNDSGITIENIRIWGSPVQPEFLNWAFNRERGEEIKKHWNLIPKDTNLLITHGPPEGILDKTIRGKSVGCLDLLNRVNNIQPKIHVFGHIHEEYGVYKTANTTFINASILNERYRNTNDAVVVDW